MIKKTNSKPLLKGSGKKVGIVKEQKVLTKEDMLAFNVFEKELEARRFVDALVAASGNLSAAVRNAYPSYAGRSAEDCYKRGMVIMKKEKVKELVEQEMKAQGVSVGGIINDIVVISKEAGRDADKLRALELLGKFKKMFESEVVKNQTLNLNISEDAARRILERRDKFNIGKGGRFQGIDDSGGDSSVDVIEP